jgi:hypothetical protein
MSTLPTYDQLADRVTELERLLREARGYLSAQPPPEFMSHVLSLLGRLDVVLGPPHA